MPYLKRLTINDLRNLNTVDIKPSSTVNLFYGDNGSGKSSLLEAVSLLGLGRSFRSHKNHSLIKHGYNELVVFSEIMDVEHQFNLGLKKDRQGKTSIKTNGSIVKTASILATYLPLQIIDAKSFRLIEGSPQDRRRFLDWMVFHVKPDFMGLWQRYLRVLKQRNSLLKDDKINVREQLLPWQKEFLDVSEQIHLLRKETFDNFKRVMSELNQEYADFMCNLDYRYCPGWHLEKGLSQVLDQDLERDKRDGYTHHGPHRADIKITQSGTLAADILSRGQEKTLICALHIAQARLYKSVLNKTCLFLIDDLLAELDQFRAKQLVHWLKELGGQVFATGVNKDLLKKLWLHQPELGLFHVKHGEIIADSE